MDSSTSAIMVDADPRLARKRVTRACDSCRRRKARCDGSTHCSACRSIGLSCSYGHSTAKQARGPGYVAHLERTVEELQLQSRRIPATHIPSSKHSSASGSSASPAWPTSDEGIAAISDERSLSNSQDTPSSESQQPEPATFYVEIIAREPRAKSFGIDVLRQLCIFCYDLPRPGGSHRQDSAMKLVQALDAPFPLDDYPVGSSGMPPLPAAEVMFMWIELAFSEALPLWHFIDKEHVQSILPRMWNPGFGHEEGDKDDLGLLYAVLALGQRFEISNNEPNERRLQGLKFFAAARDAVPLASCERSVPALQTVLCMALYLTATSSQTRYHAYVSSAASAALRMGLHEQILGFPEEEQALRRRVWFAVQAMDVNSSSALGLPSIVSGAEPQSESFGSISPGIDEMTLATAAHHQLTGVLSNCIDRVYRNRESKAASTTQSRLVSTRSLRESSEELSTWGHNCAFIAQQLDVDVLALSVEDVGRTPMPQLSACTRTQLLLYYAHCHAQLLLYTPLVHHLVNPNTERTSEAYLFGIRCFRSALWAVHVAEELQRRYQLIEAYFQTVDVLVNTLLVLLTVELGSSDAVLLREAIPAGRRAKDVLLNLCPLSLKASECWEALAPLYQKGKSEPPKSQNVRKNVANIRDSFKSSYNTHYAGNSSIDPLILWTNEHMDS